VTLGQLKLESLDQPAESLGHFDAYLSRHPAGMLSEEARLGRVRAVSRLEEHGALIEAATEYLQLFPGGRGGSEVLRLRADTHRSSGDLERAVEDYQELIDRWPGSPHAAEARTALEACRVEP